MILCPTCGEENPERARFCLACATPLEAVAGPPDEERKVVSVLFVDLVGFTGRSEHADPEDVRATLRPYHARLKQEIERFGGTVEKFVGDAVMAVFGAPVSHEDDPERAVRAALRILEAVEELELSVRAAVNTGEAVVALGARPAEGEGIVAGDVVNTAARLQAVAPVGGLVVGEATYRATSALFEYEQLEPVSVKGKSEPVSLWQAKAARMRFGVDVEAGPRTPFVGRADDFAVLQSAYARMLPESSVQLVTVTGEPGVGKTRLLAEFRTWVDDQPEIIYWRQGRSLPYGEGVTYWALGEMVKAHAGILESDDPEEAAAKLEYVLGEEDNADRDWLRARLAPLVGAGESGAVDRDESFAAWRTFLEGIAAQRPLILVFEDLHWANEALLSFVEHLVDWSTGIPMLVVCSARPELYERAPGWGGGKRNSTTIALSPLTGDDTARLLAALLERAVLPAETQTTLLERCGGNPLYAEEFARMVKERGDGKIAVPETVHALIAARLDTLPVERKSLLHDAAVVGKVFWAGAVASMGGLDVDEVREGLHTLARKELVRPVRTSSVEDEVEYAFWHVLVRDVAYGQIPRATRGRKHTAAAAWIEQMAGDRVADHAELLAHHYGQALELARASGEAATSLGEPARRFLLMAGQRALALDPSAAESFFVQALELAGADEPERPEILEWLGRTALQLGRLDEAAALEEEAGRLFRASGNAVGQASCLLWQAHTEWYRGNREAFEPLAEQALALLEREPPGPVHVHAYARMAGHHMHYERPRECIEWADRAIAIGDTSEAEHWTLASRQFRGFSQCELGDLRGREELREVLRLSLDKGLALSTSVAHLNLGDIEWWVEGPALGLEHYRSGKELARGRGLIAQMAWGQAQELWPLYELGRWDELLRSARELTESSRARGGSATEPISLSYEALVLVRRGQTGQAAPLAEKFLPLIRVTNEPQVSVPALLTAALVEQARGQAPSALKLVREFAEATRDRPMSRSLHLPTAVRIFAWAGKSDEAAALLTGAGEELPRMRFSALEARAIVAEARNDLLGAAELYAEAAERWAEYGYVLERGEALLGAGRCRMAQGLDGRAAVAEAREIFASLGAQPLVQEAGALLGTESAAAGEA